MAEVEMKRVEKEMEDAEAGLIDGDGAATGPLDSSAPAGPACVWSTTCPHFRNRDIGLHSQPKG